MTAPRHIHILGASACGTTTLGIHLAARLQCAVFDTDNFYWLPCDPPFLHKRSIEGRLALLMPELARHPNWVLSGSMISWGQPIIEQFTDVVFLTLDSSVRLERLRVRDVQRYGESRLAVDGDLHGKHEAFMAWSALYDSAGIERRSLAAHEGWIATLPASVRVLRLDSAASTDALVERCLSALHN